MKLADLKDYCDRIHRFCEESGDGMFLMYFSKEEDKWGAGATGLDMLDIGIVVQQFFTFVMRKLNEAEAPMFIGYGMVTQIRDECNRMLKECEKEMGAPDEAADSGGS